MVRKRMGLLKRDPSHRVGIFIDDSIEMYSAILACWFLNKAYVPVNPEYPVQRMREIIKIADLDSFWANDSVQIPELNDSVKIMRYSENKSDFDFDSIPYFDPEKEAYILFTSGTSGSPKGVPISHKNLQAFLEGFFDLGYSLSKNDRFLQMFELTFDLSVMSFAAPLILGTSFYPLEKKIIKPLSLFNTLSNYNITFSLMVPSVVNMLAPYKEEIELDQLKYTQFCGDAFKTHKLRNLADLCAKLPN